MYGNDGRCPERSRDEVNGKAREPCSHLVVRQEIIRMVIIITILSFYFSLRNLPTNLRLYPKNKKDARSC